MLSFYKSRMWSLFLPSRLGEHVYFDGESAIL